MLAESSRTEASPARRLPLFALYTANAVSQIGDMLMFLAIPWFVLQTTGSITQTGIAAFFTFASVGLSALLGSAIVDRLGFQRASVVSDLASAGCVALIPLLYATVGLPFWALLALIFFAGVLTTPGQTARSALVPDLAQLARVRIERVTAAKDGVTRLSRFAGAPLAGILIAVIGTSNLLWIDAATFAFSALAIGVAVPVRLSMPALATAPLPDSAVPVASSDESGNAHGAAPIGTAEREARAAGYLAGLRQGIAFLWHDRVLRDTTLVVFITNVLDTGQSGVLAPAFVKQVYGNALI
ncbi:MAG: MFS transporter, partial [Ktedonobacterales bacterium]